MDLSEVNSPTVSGRDYENKLSQLQMKLLSLQLGLYQSGRRAIIVFEGTDASGKGGVIKRMFQRADPRGFRVYPIGPPSSEEAAQHYLQRFWRRLPRAGQIAVFDRSWYGRVLVERVENHTAETAWQRAYQELNAFEQLLIDDDVILLKFFLHIDKSEQERRFKDRLNTPHKHWKITCADLDSRRFWDDYQQAFQDMLDRTSSASAPWFVVPANHKRYARLAVLQQACDVFEEHIDSDAVELLDPQVKLMADELFGKK